MTREKFAEAKFGWLKRVCSDARVTHIAARVAVLISDRLNYQTLEAFPGQDLLARECGVSDRYIRTATDLLETLGYMTIIRAGRQPNRYRAHLAEETGTIVPFETGDDRNSGSGQSGAQAEQEFRTDLVSTGTIVPVVEDFDRNNGSTPTGTGVPPNPLREQVVEDTPPNPPAPPKPAAKSREAIIAWAEPLFRLWWEVYPLKKGRKPALAAFAPILFYQKATFEELMHGAQAYRREREGKDPSKTKYAQGWLNDERWKDAPLPPTAGRYQTDGFSYTEHAIGRLDLFGVDG